MNWGDVANALISTRTDGVRNYGSFGGVQVRSDGLAKDLGNGLTITSDGFESRVGSAIFKSNGNVEVDYGSALTNLFG